MERGARFRVERFVKQIFYVRYDYGAGRLWYEMTAESVAAIEAKYPFLTASTSRPGWWKFRHPSPSFDIDDVNPALEKFRSDYEAGTRDTSRGIVSILFCLTLVAAAGCLIA